MQTKTKKLIVSLSSLVLSGFLLNHYMTVGAEETTTNTIQQSQKEVQYQQRDTKNLVENGDFGQTEDGSSPWTGSKAQGWSTWVDQKNSSADASTRVIEAKDGAITISSPEKLRAAVHRMVPIEAKKKYKLRFKIKTDNKVGIAKVRIIEESGKDKRLWNSATTSGTKDWQTIEADYSPTLDVDKIKLELFYETGTGTGTVSFKDIELVEVADQLSEDSQTDKQLEEKIDLPIGKKHVFSLADYTYKVENPDVASVKNGILEPLKEGTTNVIVSKDGKEVKKIPLKILASVKDAYTARLDDWNGIIAGNQYYDSKNEQMAKLNQELEGKVADSLSSISSQADRTYLWEKFSNYKMSANLTATYRKLEEMAKQVTNPSSRYYQDETVVRTVRDSMEWMHKHVYNSEKSIVGNWWDYEIGTPRAINNTLSLMKEYFSDEEIKKYTDVIEKFVPDPEHFRKTTDNPFKALGGNLVDMGRVKVIAGLLRKDDQEISSTIRSIEQVFKLVDQGEGFYQDGSYIDHTNVAYTGAYGNVLIDGLSQLLPVIQKTKNPIDKDKMQTMYHWIDKSFAPLLVNGELMDMSRGRSISRANSEGHVAAVEVLRGIHRIADMSEGETKQRLQSLVKTIVQSDSYYDVFKNLKTYKDISLMQSLLSDAGVASVPRTSYLSAFNKMDKTAMYNAEKGFGFGLSLFSSRTLNYEHMNKENKRGWYTSDGMFYLYNGDLSHYSDGYWPTVNPYKMPGTTETDAKRADSDTGKVLPSAFVGTSKLDDANATATMDFTNWNQTLTAHKSWFMLKDKIAFLGSNIQNTSTDTAATTIDQRKLESSNPYKVYVNDKEASLTEQEKDYPETQSVFLESFDSKKNIGYFFFKKSSISMSKALQKGAWKDINEGQSDKEVENEFLTISQAHKQNGDSYGYMLIPNVDRATFNQMIKELESSLIENNETLQSVYDAKQGVWGIVKYDDSVSTISNQFQVLKRGVYTIRKEGDEYKIAYYNPETQESAPDQEVFKKLEQAAQPQVQNSKEKEKSEEEKNHSDQKNLPQTGEGQSILASLGFLLLGAFYLFRRGKNN
ncbi:LPXTG-anchored hyaluronate lyase [Streptococcus pneumoniae]|uniref:polysaccharide lyase family 8 super-sandwich domain-containing protein n=1 Tax=Streptococcus pneumoniae TaxID=1313 RepID=UPI001C5F8D3E|nr:polysaccharide lyase family 8 super-sandwich domain-containing protein [Streptococcus pneumoniae]MBW4999553.1 LPXTG-anchored hyaluronate lyase [Streptococcus pneumoniae]MBW5001581.1 LPXTG-anchored hyaluronate lyase [Streptococcus pneumoniae]MBW5015819.1 LPXTG-anchored hyaluronate lyase [Streptococcus pneumoniae]MBW5029869.1 LPXTG-anchored hyaluronate lyase [Streptococcus pneumoniae]MBW5055844.1 LPXTG-anchored hyaluronate lyase [Streptococcus pneumoniae]